MDLDLAQAGVALAGGTSITLALAIGDYAFVAPRAGTITSLAGFFSATAALTVLTPVQIQMQILIAPAASNTFTVQGRISIINTNIYYNSYFGHSIRDHS